MAKKLNASSSNGLWNHILAQSSRRKGNVKRTICIMGLFVVGLFVFMYSGPVTLNHLCSQDSTFTATQLQGTPSTGYSHIRVADQLDPAFALIVTETQPRFAVSVYTNGDIVSQNIKKRGYWDGGLTEIVSAILDARRDAGGAQVVVDFGTHVGWFSLLSASKGHHVIAIEPMDSNRRALRQSIALNGFNDLIELHAGALGDGGPSSPTQLCIGARVTGSNIGNGQTSDAGEGCAEIVPVLTLGSTIGRRKVAFLKADCEGCEANALLGMQGIFKGGSPPCSISIEWRPESMRELGGDPSSAAQLLFSSGYQFFSQHCDLVTGKGLRFDEIPMGHVMDWLPAKNMDLILLHDSLECFARGGRAFQFVMDRVASFEPDLLPADLE